MRPTASFGRGALVMNTTAVPRARARINASQAAGKASTPLCTTPQTSLRMTS